jgi:hypothetical protein
MRQREIFLFWLPLFSSWLLMTAEGPIISATINRLPNEVIMLAAQGIVVSLSVTIESPIINLLATSTALCEDRGTYLLLRKFTLHWMVLLTGITIAIAFTPLFDLLVINLLGVPQEIAIWVKPGLRIMTFWSAAIAWRRFLQGMMIRFNQTRKVAWGTVVRLVFSGATAIGLALWSGWPGAIIGSSALMAGVLAEAAYATIAIQPILRGELGEAGLSEGVDELTYRELFWFHLPLAATSVMVLLVQPLIAFSLARLPNTRLTLAAWPVVFQFMLVSRAAAFALPEAVIALSNGEGTFRPIRRFAYLLAVVNSTLILLVVLTPLLDGYLLGVQDLTRPVSELARSGLILFLPLPALTVLISWIRGLLIDRHVTRAVNAGMVVNLAVTTLIVLMSMQRQWPGIDSAAIALTTAAAIELIYLSWRASGALGFRFSFIEIRRSNALTG